MTKRKRNRKQKKVKYLTEFQGSKTPAKKNKPMYFQSANSRNFYTDDELRTMINVVAKEKNLEIPTLNKEEITALSDEVNQRFSVDSTSYELIELLKEELSTLEQEDRALTLSNVT